MDDNADDLLRYLRRRVRKPEDAADLLGRVLLALWETGEKVPTSDTDARMWCFAIARNVLREHHRHAAKHLALADELRTHLRGSMTEQNSADLAAESNIRDARVRVAVMSLDTRTRELVMLVHWDGFTIAAAARLLSMNESSARTRYGRGLQRLERELREPPHSDRVGHTVAPNPT
ncbi:RNA polymerase sigma factor [Microbacterium aurantiacum]|uniref:RNA polymerase sigma factor n=1 Tax=Microbacterium aurantiacum TaxID=162393 RepID=UPI0018D1D39C|nr:sigma-70 family RNA polymerase sigma factor [Microbacterium chocolatum]